MENKIIISGSPEDVCKIINNLCDRFGRKKSVYQVVEEIGKGGELWLC